VPKGTPRSKDYGTGTALRTTASLAAVLRQEDLPAPRAPTELPLGEIRALQQSGAMDFVKPLETQHKKPKTKKPAPTPQLTPS